MRFLSKLNRFFDDEKGHLIPIRVLQRLTEQVIGKLRAKLWGWPRGFISSGARIIGSRHIVVGENSSVGRHAWIETISRYGAITYKPSIEIGINFSASERLHIACVNQITVGNNCLFGSSVHITDHGHGIYRGINSDLPDVSPALRPLSSDATVKIGSNVWLGDNVVVIGPAEIGDGVIIGANSVVKGDIPANVIACGAPARVIKVFDKDLGFWQTVCS